MDDINASSLLRRIGQRIAAHLTIYGSTYWTIGILLSIVLAYSSNSGPKLCMINNFQFGKPVLSNVSLYPEGTGVFSSAPKSVSGTVSGNNIHISSGDYGTRMEVRRWGRNGAAGGSYAELTGEVLCRDSDICPAVMSSGDYIGIPTKEVRTSRVVVMYTIFLLPTLEERARGRVCDNCINVDVTQVETLWDEVIQYFCGNLLSLLIGAVVYLVLLLKEAVELRLHASRYPLPVQQDPTQDLLPGPMNDQDQQALGQAPSTSDGPDAVGDSDSPPLQHSTDADTSRLTSVPDDLRSNSDSLVSAKPEKGGSGNCRMVGPRHSGLPHAKKLGTMSSSSSSSDEQGSSDSSSEDDSKSSSNIQEVSTPDVPPPHYVRHRAGTVYWTIPGDTTVPRPTPEGFECSI